MLYLADEGAVPNKCFPYVGEGRNCGVACSNPILKVRVDRLLEIVNFQYPAHSEAKIKRALLEHGPLVFGRPSKWHYMVLIGFDRDARTGRTIWIVKNSWGESWGNHGFGRIVTPVSDLRRIFAFKGVELRYRGRVVRSSCRDEDGDGYSVWGFGLPRPKGCPSRDGLPDCNDASPHLGPMLASGRCALIEDLEPTPTTGGGQSGPGNGNGAAVGGGGGGEAGGLLLLLLAACLGHPTIRTLRVTGLRH